MVVDSGNQMLTLFENGQPLRPDEGGRGKAEYPTPMIASIMYYIVYNPYWNAPDHLARKIAQNYLSMGDGYLKSRGYQVMTRLDRDARRSCPISEVDWKGVAVGQGADPHPPEAERRQQHGGFEIPLPQRRWTSSSTTRRTRNISRAARGCCRTAASGSRMRAGFGRWLLGKEPVAPNGDAEVQVQLPQGVPIYLTYVTAQVRDGKIAYLADPYGWDPKVAAGKAAGKVIAA